MRQKYSMPGTKVVACQRSDHRCCGAVAGAVAAALWGLSQASSLAQGSQPVSEMQAAQAAQSAPRENAVLVFGASGRLGQEVVAEVGVQTIAPETAS